MELILKELQLQNFKGIKDLTINFNKNTDILGANASGKTTIFDAYSWLLWNKDSFNKKDFDIKPFNENGETIHGVDCTVKGILQIISEDYTGDIELKKVYKENWKKKRGQTETVFDGNSTNHYINDVPAKQSEYNSRIETLINEDEFKLLSNPFYFNFILNNKERRNVLLSLIKDVSKDEIIAKNEDLKDLELDKYSIKEIQAMSKSSLKKINDEIQSLPTRIDELQKSKNDYDFSGLEKEKESIKKELDDIDIILNKNTDITGIVTAKNNEIQSILEEIRNIKVDIDTQNSKLKSEAEREYNEKFEKYLQSKRSLENSISEAETQIKHIDSKIKMNQDSISFNEKRLEDLREQWIKEDEKKFNGSLVCPTCNREFEEDRKEQILQDFNQNKSRILTILEKDGQGINELLEKSRSTISLLQEEQNEYINNLNNLKNTYNNLGGFNEEKPTIKTIEYPEKIKELEEKIEVIKQDIKNINSVDNTEYLLKKRDLQNNLEIIISKLGLKEQNSHIDKKISDYMEQEKELAKMYEEKQRILYLCEDYIKIYTALVQDEINNLFTEVDFKLFDTQVNGEIKETCEATVKGVPYSSVNNAGKINAGLDIINTLSKKLGKKVPIFVDNAESVNKLIDVDSQIVKLFVSENEELIIR